MKIYEINIPGTIRTKKTTQQPTPIPSKNITTIMKYYKKRGWVHVRMIILPGSAYRTWERGAKIEASRQLKSQGLFDPLKGAVSVCVFAHFKGPRPDLSGVLESCGDFLEGIGWANDRQIESWDGSRLIHDVKNPRTIIYFRSIDDA